MSKEVVKLKKVSKVYRSGDIETTALIDVNLVVEKGDFISILGPSGSGKSTLLHIMGLLDRPTKGEVYYNNTRVDTLEDDELSHIRNKEIGFVFQSFNLIPSLTVFENIEMPMIIAGVEKEKRKMHVMRIMKSLGIEHRANHKPNQISGGERQRVAIGRALINNPSVILADEPTGNLDTKRGTEIMGILKELNNDGKTIVLITHDQNIARHSKRIIRIKDGRII